MKVPPILIDIVGVSAILFWFGLSIYFFSNGESTLFQSSGAIGVAAAIGYFALQRHSLPHPPGLLDRLNAIELNLNLVSVEQQRQNGRSAMLAYGVQSEFERLGCQVSPVIGSLANVDPNIVQKSVLMKFDDVEEKLKGFHQSQVAADKFVRRTHWNAEVLQLLVVILATLQSGLGAFAVANWR